MLPGGQIFVYTGLVNFVGKDDDGLACVLGHEMAHAILRHQAEQMSLKTVWLSVNAAMIAAMWFVFQSDVLAWLATQAEEKLFGALTELPWSRKLETEADHAGLLFASWACYNPEAGPLVREMMDNHAKVPFPNHLVATRLPRCQAPAYIECWLFPGH